MKIKPTVNSSVVHKAETRNIDSLTGEYRDPLMKWPLRGAAFTNEIGEALRPIIGNYATLTWAPALLYIGADIYDKYKNNQTEYSPDSKRCLKQACFQGLASILLPIIAVKGGQNLFSLFGLKGKEKISYNIQEQINKLAQQFVANGKLHMHKNNDEECIKEFLEMVNHNIDYKRQEDIAVNPLKKIFSIDKLNKKENVDKYAQKIIKKTIRMRRLLSNPNKKVENTYLFSSYKAALESGQTRNVAKTSVINKFLERKALKGRFVKTIGGFLALGIAIKPIDLFVEEVLIGKVIGPTIDMNKKKSKP